MKWEIVFLFLFLIPIVSSVEIGSSNTNIRGVIIQQPVSEINLSQINVNNSQYLQGLIPQQVANLFTSVYLYNQSLSSFNSYGGFWYNQTNLGGWNWSGNNIYQNDLGDSVGIGTTDPTHSLSILGTTGALLNISGTSGEIYTSFGARQLVLTGVPTGLNFNNAPLVVNVIGIGNHNRTLFGVGVAGSQRFKIDEDGDVEILSDLTVGGSLVNIWLYNQTINSIYDYNQTYSGSTYNATYNKWAYNMTIINSTYLYNQTQAGSLYSYNQSNLGGWNWSGNYVYQNDLSDYVGIGTTTPEDLLNVYGGQLKINDTIGSTGVNELDSSILVQRGNSGTFLGARLTASNNRFFMYIDASNVYYRTVGTDSLRFGVDNSDDLTIITGGKVGIGTTTPTHSLNVVGSINVSGSFMGDALSGAGNGYACINSTGGIFRSASACV